LPKALKILAARKRIEVIDADLSTYTMEQAGFSVREKQLQTELDAAKGDALDTVIKSIQEFDARRDAVTAGLAQLQQEKSQLEAQIKEMDQAVGEVRSLATASGEYQEDPGFFRPVCFTREKGAALIRRAEVREFLDRFKDVIRSGVTNAEILIPDVFLGVIRDNLDEYSKLIGVVNLRQITGTSRLILRPAPQEAVWTEQCANLNEMSISVYEVEIEGYKVGGYIRICNATLEDSTYLSLADEIVRELTQGIGLALDKAILYGTGVKMPQGIVTRLAQTAQPASWLATSPAWTNLAASNILSQNLDALPANEYFAKLLLMTGQIEANYATGGTFWCMSRKTWAEMQAKGLVINALGIIMSSVSPVMPVEGGRIILLDFIPKGDIIGGYGSLYTLVQRHGLVMRRSEHRFILEDDTVFTGTMRFDGKAVVGEGFVAINIDGNPVTTTMTFAPDVANTATPGGDGGDG